MSEQVNQFDRSIWTEDQKDPVTKKEGIRLGDVKEAWLMGPVKVFLEDERCKRKVLAQVWDIMVNDHEPVATINDKAMAMYLAGALQANILGEENSEVCPVELDQEITFEVEEWVHRGTKELHGSILMLRGGEPIGGADTMEFAKFFAEWLE